MAEKFPVFEVTADTMWNYEYQARNPCSATILASDSLRKLKAAVKENRWKLAWITTSHGALSYGQEIVDDYPYRPRYV